MPRVNVNVQGRDLPLDIPDEPRCPRCGAVLAWHWCESCGGDGADGDGRRCPECGRDGGWYECWEHGAFTPASVEWPRGGGR